MREHLGIDGALPHVELLHLMGGAGSPDGAAFGCMAGPLPRGGAGSHDPRRKHGRDCLYVPPSLCQSERSTSAYKHIRSD